MASYHIIYHDEVGCVDQPTQPNQLHSNEAVAVSDELRCENVTWPIRNDDTVTASDGFRRLWYQTGTAHCMQHTAPCGRTQWAPRGHKIDPLLRNPIAILQPGESYSFQLEDWIRGASIQRPLVRLRAVGDIQKVNPVGVEIVKQLLDQITGQFYEIPVVVENLNPGEWIDFEPYSVIARGLRVTHQIEFTNNDTTFRVVYAAIHGWRGIPTSQPSFSAYGETYDY